MSGRHPITPLLWKDRRAFVALMENAFSPDPLFYKVFVHNQTARAASRRVKAFLSFMFDLSMLMGAEVRGLGDEDRLVGAYILELPLKNSLRQAGGALLALIRGLVLPFQISGRSFWLLNGYMRLTRAEAPRGRLYYLTLIGVHEVARGQGFGRALLREIINRVECDEQAVGIALDTENCANIGFYKQFGFALYKEVCLEGLTIYCMFRKQ